MTDTMNAVQKAIYTALSGISCSVYDAVPQNASYPYVVISSEEVGTSAEEPYVGHLDEHYVYLSVWSRYEGQKEVKGILNEIRTALHDVVISLEEGRSVRCKVPRLRSNREPDNLTFMGQATVHLIVEH